MLHLRAPYGHDKAVADRARIGRNPVLLHGGAIPVVSIPERIAIKSIVITN